MKNIYDYNVIDVEQKIITQKYQCFVKKNEKWYSEKISEFSWYIGMNLLDFIKKLKDCSLNDFSHIYKISDNTIYIKNYIETDTKLSERLEKELQSAIEKDKEKQKIEREDLYIKLKKEFSF